MALDFGKLNFSTSFNPTSAFPIDARSYFESLAAAQEAAATAEAAGSSNTHNIKIHLFQPIKTNLISSSNPLKYSSSI